MTTPRLPSMSPTESLVMELLRGRERYGLELVDASDGALKRGSVYVTLARMEEKGFVDSRQEDRDQGTSGLPRRLYRATPYGRKVHGAFATTAGGVGPEADGGEMSFDVAGHRHLRSLRVAARVRSHRHAGPGRPGV